MHSPFAFSLITDVIYEKMPYYAYDLLKAEQKKRITTQGWEKGIPKINRLLFRLVNKVQPATIIEVGQPSAASLYLQSAKPSAGYLFASDLSELFLDADTPVDFLYLNDYRNPALLEEVFNICSRRTTPNSLFVVHGICYSKAMKNLWKQLQNDERVGITFDLYDVSVLYALAVELNILQRILVSHFDIPDEVYAELRRKARAEVAVSRKGAQIESVQAQMFGGDTGWQSSSQNGAI